MLLRSLLVLATLVAPSAAHALERALDLLDVPVSYTADFYVSSPRGTYRGSLWHAPGRERRDFDTEGGGQTLLLRRDTDAAYLMKPSGKWYVGLGFQAVGALAGGIDALSVERSRVAEETVGGIRATRYRIKASGPRNTRFDGDGWFSREGILVRAHGTVTGPDGRRQPVETALSRLKVGRIDERVFELPSGYFGMDLRSVPPERIEQAVESLRPMLEQR